MDQIELGKISGVSNVQISRYEKGLSKPTVKTLSKLAKGLGIEPNQIFLEQDLERLKQVIKTDDDRKMLNAMTEMLYHKNR